LRYIVILLVGLGCGALAWWLSLTELSEARASLETQRYMVLRTDLDEEFVEIGDTLEASDIGFIDLPKGDDILPTLVIAATDENLEYVRLRPVNARIARGKILTYDLFEGLDTKRLDEVIAIGHRAFALPVNAQSSLNYQVLPGNRIDVGGVSRSRGQTEASWLLQDVRVIGVGNIFSYDEWIASGNESYSTITIEVTPEKALEFAANQRTIDGGIVIVLRNQCDTTAEAVGCP